MKRVLQGFLALGFIVTAGRANADLLCIKNSVKPKASISTKGLLVVTSTASCPKGTSLVLNTATFTGPQGAQGPARADGSVAVYGDGSNGAAAIASNTTFTNVNAQYTSFTVNSGVTLIVPTGAIIRCTGTFTNNGTIVVDVGGIGGREWEQGNYNSTTFDIPAVGVASTAASIGQIEFGIRGGTGGYAFQGFLPAS